jgi:osmotically-inducible protein OsmY
VADGDSRCEAVKLGLATDKDMASLGVWVGVLQAVVYLTGRAPSRRLWQQAQDVAAGVAGVRGVVNRIEPPGAPRPARTVSIPLAGRGGRRA